LKTIESAVTITTPDARVSGVLCRPDAPGRYPGVLFFPDVGGFRASQSEMIGRLAARGFVVLAPNLYHRTGEPPFMTFPPDFNDPKIRAIFMALKTPMTPDAVERDCGAFVDYLAAMPEVAPGRVGAVGYCFGGAIALRAAAARPQTVGAAASFHGGGLFTPEADSPHLLLPKVKARLYFGHADSDRSMPAEAIAGLDGALKAWGGTSVSETYAGARHGWCVPDSAEFQKAAADRAFETLTEFFKAALP
jgi:carboxymethylenebutenolidase